MPTIITRAQWGADESMKRWRRRRCPATRARVVHHTVNANDYTQAEVPSILRGIYAYHTQTLGWCDIGYQFLVDRFGRVYEGRSGGLTTFIQGAQTGGFNSETVGVSVIGDHRTVPFSAATKSSVSAMIAWLADRANFDPAGSATFTSAGNSKYPAGTRVTKSRVSGHRDFGSTECPGDAGYAQIPSIRSSAASAWRTGRRRFRRCPRARSSRPSVPGRLVRRTRRSRVGPRTGDVAVRRLRRGQVRPHGDPDHGFYYPGTTLVAQGDPQSGSISQLWARGHHRAGAGWTDAQ